MKNAIKHASYGGSEGNKLWEGSEDTELQEAFKKIKLSQDRTVGRQKPHEALRRLMSTFKVDGLTRALTHQL